MGGIIIFYFGNYSLFLLSLLPWLLSAFAFAAFAFVAFAFVAFAFAFAFAFAAFAFVAFAFAFAFASAAFCSFSVFLLLCCIMLHLFLFVSTSISQ